MSELVTINVQIDDVTIPGIAKIPDGMLSSDLKVLLSRREARLREIGKSLLDEIKQGLGGEYTISSGKIEPPIQLDERD